MSVKERGTTRVGATTLLKILSPLLGWALFIAYLALYSQSPFLLKWLDGSFALFIALVLCNILRGAASRPPEEPRSGD